MCFPANPHSQPCTPLRPPCHLPEHSATHTCCPLPSESFKEVSVPEKSKPLGRLLEATVALLSQFKNPFAKKVFTKRKAKRKGGYDNRRAGQTISSPDTGKLVLEVTCF